MLHASPAGARRVDGGVPRVRQSRIDDLAPDRRIFHGPDACFFRQFGDDRQSTAACDLCGRHRTDYRRPWDGVPYADVQEPGQLLHVDADEVASMERILLPGVTVENGECV